METYKNPYTLNLDTYNIFNTPDIENFRNWIEYLTENIGIRPLDSSGNNQTIDWLSTTLTSFSSNISLEIVGSHRSVIGILPGRLHKTSNKIVVVGAHFDTVSITPGANDNAGGVALLLEVARALSSISTLTLFNYDIYFVAFNGEEAALYGSFEVVEYLVKLGKEVLICVNADMILYNDPDQPENGKQAFMFKGDNVLWSSAKYEEWGNLSARISYVLGEGYIYTKPAGTNDVFTLHSDHGAFWLEKFPALFVHSGRDQYYHRPEDTLANPELNLTYPLESARTTAVLVYLTTIYGRQVLDLSDHDGDDIDTQLELIQGTYDLAPEINPEDLILDSSSTSYIDNLTKNSSKKIDFLNVLILSITLLICVFFRKLKLK
jgi:hypothetical protein